MSTIENSSNQNQETTYSLQVVPSRFSERLWQIKEQIIPLTNYLWDQLGNRLQLWSIPGAQVAGILLRPDSSYRYIAPQTIHNSVNPQDNPTTIHNRLLSAIATTWDYVIRKNGHLYLWPHLNAGGWRDVIPKSPGDLNGIAKLASRKTREQMCEFFYRNGFQLEKDPEAQLTITL